jgi:hypothetical protein
MSDRRRRNDQLLETLAHAVQRDENGDWPRSAVVEEGRRYLANMPEPPPNDPRLEAFDQLHEAVEAWVDEHLELGSAGIRLERDVLAVIRRYQEQNIPIEDRRRSVRLKIEGQLRQRFEPTHLSQRPTEGHE